MKKIVSILLFLPVFAFAQTRVNGCNLAFGDVGMPFYTTIDPYQKLVGQVYIYVPTKDSFEGAEALSEGSEYVLSKATRGSGEYIFIFKENIKKGRTFKVKAPYSVAFKLPFVDISEFEKKKNQVIGVVAKNDRVVNSHRVVDFAIINTGNDCTGYKVPAYILENGESFNYVKYEITKISEWAFQNDLGGKWEFQLTEVEKTGNTSGEYGEVQSIEEDGVTKYSFADEYINMIIFGGIREFNFSLTNKSQSSIKLIWDEAVFVGADGSISKIMHKGIKYSQREASQPASTIIRAATLNDIACPIDNVRYSDVQKEWVVDAMFPFEVFNEIYQVRLMLPIQVKDVVSEYVFVFNIKYVFNHPDRIVK